MEKQLHNSLCVKCGECDRQQGHDRCEFCLEETHFKCSGCGEWADKLERTRRLSGDFCEACEQWEEREAEHQRATNLWLEKNR